MTEPPITSPMTRRIAALSAQLVSSQKTVLRVTLGEVKWLYEIEGLGTKLASDILKVILSGGDDDSEDQTDLPARREGHERSPRSLHPGCSRRSGG